MYGGGLAGNGWSQRITAPSVQHALVFVLVWFGNTILGLTCETLLCVTCDTVTPFEHGGKHSTLWQGWLGNARYRIHHVLLCTRSPRCPPCVDLSRMPNTLHLQPCLRQASAPVSWRPIVSLPEAGRSSGILGLPRHSRGRMGKSWTFVDQNDAA